MLRILDWIRRTVSERVYRSSKKDEYVSNQMLSSSFIFDLMFSDKHILDTVCSVRAGLLSCTATMDTIELVDAHFCETKFLNYVAELDIILRKGDDIVVRLLDRADVHFEKAKYWEGLHCCNLAIVNAPKDSALFSRLLTIRAKFLYETKQWELCIMDASAVVNFGQSQHLQKLQAIMKSSLRMLMIEKKMHSSWNSSESLRRKKFRDEVLFEVYGERNEKIPSASKYISIVEHKRKGRTLVFTENLKPGVTVIVEEPYVALLSGLTKWQLKLCAKCYKKAPAVVPCPNCVFMSYCSENCQKADQDAHKYECPCLNYLHAARVEVTEHMSFRVICKAGPENMFKLYQRLKSGNIQAADLPKGFNPDTGMYESDKYFQIYNLVFHPTRDTAEYYSWMAWLAYTMTKLLESRTDYFDGIERNHRKEFSKFVAATIFRHSLLIPYNVIGLLEDTRDTGKPGVGLRGLFSLCSLTSHSCDPSAIRINLQNGKLAVITARPVRAGEELTISYGYEFWLDSFEERSQLSDTLYRFECDCAACICNWPLLDQLSLDHNFLCPNCSPQLTRTEIALEQKGVLRNQDTGCGFCTICKGKFNVHDLKVILLENIKKFMRARKSLQKSPVQAFPLITESIECFHATLGPPSLLMFAALQDLHYTIKLIASEM